jgi:hypothetical protein
MARMVADVVARSLDSMAAPAARKKRLAFGGNRKRKFTEGWVEFLDKKIARRVATALNGQPIGAPRGWPSDPKSLTACAHGQAGKSPATTTTTCGASSICPRLSGTICRSKSVCASQLSFVNLTCPCCSSFARAAYEKATREQRLRAELSQAKKLATAYSTNVERSKMLADVRQRKEAKGLPVSKVQ